ncbi:MAG TPA: peptide chain release factor N(5)-glutamine methyltransferase [Spongiibacteraceae bacterium]|jgi:release factor glutamine methyltransferase|nr:peptide chain release factor N(5)-glutamine methyltransferase [Spongiibacteraceae bacterium]HUH37537.1 peptide chain release factor N(5)-glutamine methyltransferase [Spongiibacteraceae bacterium]
MSSIRALRARAAALAALSDTPQLDIDLLLCHCLARPRSYLYSHAGTAPDAAALARFEALFTRRLRGEPVAHLVGEREFWSLRLQVSPATLIPRPDTERLVEVALAQAGPAAARVLDLGTGTGAIALALASERPGWQVLGVDVVAEAAALAERNRRRLRLTNCAFVVSDWYAALAADRRWDLIVSNPPYLDADDPHLAQGDVRFEPRSALVAADGGLAAIDRIAQRAAQFLRPGGWLLLEHGWQQAAAVAHCLRSAGLTEVQSWRDYGGRERVSGARAV